MTEEEDIFEAVQEKKYREDIDSITANDVIDVLLYTIDDDITLEMMEKNLFAAKSRLQEWRMPRIQKLLGIQFSWEFKKEQERKKSNVVEVET